MTDQKFTGSEYMGYKVSGKLIREGIGKHEPIALENSEDVYGFMRNLEKQDNKSFYTIHLDSDKNVLACEEVYSAPESSCVIHPREVLKTALLTPADEIVLVHNHLSRDPTPSGDDFDTTHHLYDCCRILGMPLIDSVIIGRGSYFSYAEQNILKGNVPHQIGTMIQVLKHVTEKKDGSLTPGAYFAKPIFEDEDNDKDL